MGMYCHLKAMKSADVKRWLVDPEAITNLAMRQGGAMSLSLEKAWHGLHFLLTGFAWEGELPLAFLIQGGEAIGDDLGYGPPRLFEHPQVAELDAALDAISEDELWSRFDPEQMSGVYPEIWDEPE